MKERNSRLNDPHYFEELSSKMLDHADRHPHVPKRTIPLYIKWVAVAAITVLGIISYSHLNQNPKKVPEIAANPGIDLDRDTQTKKSPEGIEPVTLPGVLPIQTTIKEVQVSELQSLGADEEVINEIIPLENSETEADLLDQITEEELDELLKEYT